jgi:hypothetical protein
VWGAIVLALFLTIFIRQRLRKARARAWPNPTGR